MSEKSKDRRRGVADAIRADEIGIEYGIHGEFRLWSAYQPIFAPRDGSLGPVAVEGLIVPRVAGRPIPAAAFFDTVAPVDRLFVEAMCRDLHLRNFRNIGVDGLDLFFNCDPMIDDDPGGALDEIRLMAANLADLDLHPGMLVCEITEQTAPDGAGLADIVDEMRRQGLRIAVDDFGAGQSTEERVALVQPDVVRIDGGWFGEVCCHTSAERLFRPLVNTLHERGATVLVEGIEHPAQLRVALEAGVDLLQGFHLARPALAGALFDEEPLDIDQLLGQPTGVVALFK